MIELRNSKKKMSTALDLKVQHGRFCKCAFVVILALFMSLSLVGIPISAASTVPVLMGSGTLADSSASYVPTSQSGATIIFAVTGAGTTTGTLDGTYTFTGTLQANGLTGVVHYSLTDVFTVVVDGKAGTITVSEIGQGNSIASTFASQFNILSGTGGLSGMSGQGNLSGTMNPNTQLDTGTYTITYYIAQ